MNFTEDRLSRIDTCWQEVGAACALAEGRAHPAAGQLLGRYWGAVGRYLLGAVRDEELAGDLSQEFAVRFLRGACSGASPGRGRFRDYLKGVLQHLVCDYFRKARRAPVAVPDSFAEPADAATPSAEGADDFAACWREELLARAWDALANFEALTGQPYHAVLRFKSDNPQLSSDALAEHFGQRFGRAVTAAGFRKALQRAREKFADLLLEDLAGALPEPTREALEDELIALRLYEYCRGAVERWSPR